MAASLIVARSEGLLNLETYNRRMGRGKNKESCIIVYKYTIDMLVRTCII